MYIYKFITMYSFNCNKFSLFEIELLVLWGTVKVIPVLFGSDILDFYRYPVINNFPAFQKPLGSYNSASAQCIAVCLISLTFDTFSN